MILVPHLLENDTTIFHFHVGVSKLRLVRNAFSIACLYLHLLPAGQIAHTLYANTCSFASCPGLYINVQTIARKKYCSKLFQISVKLLSRYSVCRTTVHASTEDNQKCDRPLTSEAGKVTTTLRRSILQVMVTDWLTVGG